MRRAAVIGAVCACALAWAPPGVAAGLKTSARVAALQVALRAHKAYPGPVDGLTGPMTKAGLRTFQRRVGIRPSGRVSPATRRALGALGRPLLGERELWIGHVGWDVSSLEFRLRRLGLRPGRVDGRFTNATQRALRRFQRNSGLRADGIVGRFTIRALAHAARSSPRPLPVHVVSAGESFFSIAQRYHVSPWQLARVNGLRLTRVIVPGQRLRLPAGAHTKSASTAGRWSIQAEIDHWSAVYRVDPKLARALAWMESGFQQDVVSSVGAIGVMQLLPETWEWVDVMLLGVRTPRNASGNVRAGVRYLRWQLDEFGGDRRLALAGYYQGARAVRERGLFDDTKQYVSVILQLYGTV
jgi:peptidoglycan hydrolase-like protein with peptidoglycan-binding domain